MSNLINRDKLKIVLTNNGYGGTKLFEVINDIPADDTLDRIRTEVSDYWKDAFYPDDVMMSKRMVLGIIDKYGKAAKVENKEEWVEDENIDSSDDGRFAVKCSKCGEYNGYSKTNFCPNCGADMRGGK